jgi:hypothetical protein
MSSFVEFPRRLTEFGKRHLPFRKEENLLSTTPFQVVNLFDASKAQSNFLRRQIKAVDGQADLIVHPYYRVNEWDDPFPASSKYLTDVSNRLVRDLTEEYPLVLFESESRIGNIVDGLNRYDQGILYWVPTEEGSSNPLIPNLSDPDNWLYLFNSLKKLGITKPTVGGRYVLIHRPLDEEDRGVLDIIKSNNKHPLLNALAEQNSILVGCAGGLLFQLLLQGFDGSISEVSSPTARMELTDMRKARKQSTN